MTGTQEPDRVEHRLERRYEVPATAHEVWEAIATAEGLSVWMAPTVLDPRVGGEVRFDFGDLVSTGVVTAYEQPERFAYEEPWPVSPDEPVPAGMVEWFDRLGVDMEDVRRDLRSVTPIATEFLVESLSGGSCVIRIVSSSFGTGSDWENEFFAEMVAGWTPMLDALVAQLSGNDRQARTP